MRLDSTGKVSLDHIYSQPDPRPYFTALQPLEYRIPQEAKPWFEKMATEYRETEGVETPRIVDIGCSYGINAALLKFDTSMDELYERYVSDDPFAGIPTRAQLLDRDRQFTRSRRSPRNLLFTGLDASADALEYGVAAGYLDRAVHADLENEDPDPAQRAALSGADLVISTGCLGYVTERTLVRVVRAQGGRLPWMAHFVARMFPFDPIADALGALGYRTERVEGTFRQRKFASVEEQNGVLETMAAAGVDPEGVETEGWMHAQLYLCRPAHAPAL